MRVVPAKNGWSWLVRGFALFRKSPPMWLFLVFTYWISATLLGQIRYVGPAASTVLLPAFFVSFMVMCAVLDRGGLLRSSLLFLGFRIGLGAFCYNFSALGTYMKKEHVQESHSFTGFLPLHWWPTVSGGVSASYGDIFRENAVPPEPPSRREGA